MTATFAASAVAATAAPLFEAAGRLGSPHGEVGLGAIYASLSQLAAALAVERLVVVVDDAVLGRQALCSGRGPLPDEAVPCILGDAGVFTVPGRRLDREAADTFVAAVASLLQGAVAGTAALAVRDEVTGEVAAFAARASRHGWPFTLVLVQPHRSGRSSDRPDADAASARARLRRGDALARHGRSGFAVLLAGASDRAVPAIVRRLAPGEPLHFGLAMSPAEGCDPGALVTLASERLRAAMHAGDGPLPVATNRLRSGRRSTVWRNTNGGGER